MKNITGRTTFNLSGRGLSVQREQLTAVMHVALYRATYLFSFTTHTPKKVSYGTGIDKNASTICILTGLGWKHYGPPALHFQLHHIENDNYKHAKSVFVVIV